MTRLVVLVAVVAAGALAIAFGARAQGNVAQLEQVKENLYVIKGGGGNTAAFVTAAGVVVVDTKLQGWGQAILEKIRSVTDKPVTTIINTHTHADHVGSNAEFPPTVDIVAHENTKANMQKMPAFAGDKEAFLPRRTYADRMSLLQGADRVDLYYFGRGHTNGDTLVVFPALRAMHTGDLFPRKGAPFVDAANGGSGVEYVTTLDRALAGVKEVDTIIPGHSDVTNRASLVEYAEYMRTLVAAVRAAKQAGKSADETVTSLALPEKFKAYDTQRLKDTVATIYGELP